MWRLALLSLRLGSALLPHCDCWPFGSGLARPDAKRKDGEGQAQPKRGGEEGHAMPEREDGTARPDPKGEDGQARPNARVKEGQGWTRPSKKIEAQKHFCLVFVKIGVAWRQRPPNLLFFFFLNLKFESRKIIIIF